MDLMLLGGCMRRVVVLAVLAAGLVLAWHNRDALRTAWRDFRGEPLPAPVAPSPELADQAEAKLARLASGAERERIVLTEAEVQSLVQHRLADALPPYLDSPRVGLGRGRMRLQVRVAVDRFPRVPELREVLAFLPDTTEVAATAQLIPLDRGRVGLAVDEISASKIPLPRRLIPAMLDHLGRTAEPGLPPDALAIPLPQGAAAAYVRGDSLIFLSRARAAAPE